MMILMNNTRERGRRITMRGAQETGKLGIEDQIGDIETEIERIDGKWNIQFGPSKNDIEYNF